MPYRFSEYESPYTAQIAALMQQPGRVKADALRASGQAEAQAALQSGQRSAQLASTIGGAIQQVGQIPQQIQQQKRQQTNDALAAMQLTEAQQAEADRASLDQAVGGATDRDAILKSLPGHLQGAVRKQFQEADAAALKIQESKNAIKTHEADYFGGLGYAIQQHGYDPTAAQLAIAHAKETYADDPAMLQQIDQIAQQVQQPEALKTVADALVAGSPKWAQQAEATRKDYAGEAQAKTNAATTAADKATDNARQDRAQVATETYQGRMATAAEKRASATVAGGLTGNAQNEQANAKETALSIKDGTGSPELLLSTRATAQGIALTAELHRMGVDTNKLAREWTATKGAIRALNSTQQIRLAEVINKASASLDRLESLNSEWSKNATRWGIKAVNRASLTAAQNGAYGPEATSVAQRLDAQIADVTSELGQGIMGGNSPTDHALQLAAKNLSTDWTQKVLSDGIGQVRYNLNLAQNARNEILQGLDVQSTQIHTPPPATTAPITVGGFTVKVK